LVVGLTPGIVAASLGHYGYDPQEDTWWVGHLVALTAAISPGVGYIRAKH